MDVVLYGNTLVFLRTFTALRHTSQRDACHFCPCTMLFTALRRLFKYLWNAIRWLQAFTERATASRNVDAACMKIVVLADGSRVTADRIMNSGDDGFILRMDGAVLKVLKLYASLRADGTIEHDPEN